MLQSRSRRPRRVGVLVVVRSLPAQQGISAVEQADGAAGRDHGAVICCLVADGVSFPRFVAGDEAEGHLTALPALLQLTAGDADSG